MLALGHSEASPKGSEFWKHFVHAEKSQCYGETLAAQVPEKLPPQNGYYHFCRAGFQAALTTGGGLHS